jgi:hypothetical protein
METRLQQAFQVLRWCGATMIIAAAGTFLVQSWDQVGDVTRYLALLGTTVLLPALAYVCGIRWQEGQSARVLMLTLLALVPIHAGVLGGFVLSQFGSVSATVLPVAQWVAPSRSAALLLVAGAGAALVPMMWAAFRVLARPHARALTVASAAAHGLLLIPDRSALAATLVVVPILGMATSVAVRLKPATTESRLAIASLATPALVVAARQVFFYDVSNVFWGTIFAAGALALFVLGKRSKDATFERLSVVPTLLSIGAFVELLGDSVNLSSLRFGVRVACFRLAQLDVQGVLRANRSDPECNHGNDHPARRPAALGRASSNSGRAWSTELRLGDQPPARSLLGNRVGRVWLHHRGRARD